MNERLKKGNQRLACLSLLQVRNESLRLEYCKSKLGISLLSDQQQDSKDALLVLVGVENLKEIAEKHFTDHLCCFFVLAN